MVPRVDVGAALLAAADSMYKHGGIVNHACHGVLELVWHWLLGHSECLVMGRETEPQDQVA